MSSGKYAVSVIKYDKTANVLARAVELCDGFKELKSTDKVLLKPNIVWGSRSKKYPKYGFITTARIIEDIIILLRQYGCQDISLGEGTIEDEELGSHTMEGYKWSGMERVAKKYGVKLIDFNKGPFQEVNLDGDKIKIASAAMEANFLINVPVLKTHFQCKVSLGLKNLKGCLQMSSRRAFHQKDLHTMIALLNKSVIPKLTIIDGIYAMEHGPGAMGTAHRMNLIIAGRDSLSCDIVGSAILGIDSASVEHLQDFARLHNRKLDISTVDINGEKIGDVAKKLGWEFDYKNVFRRASIKGISFQYPGTHYCTLCAAHTDAVLLAYCTDNEGMSFDGVEICVGGDIKPRQDSKKMLLFGECSIKANKDLEGAIQVKGCPPKLAEMLIALYYNTLPKGRATRLVLERIAKTFGYKIGIYDERFPLFPKYAPPEFDENDFV